MQERTKREDFDEELIKEFASWAIKTKGMPHWEENRKEGIEKFGLTSGEFSKLLHITAEYWVF